MGKTKEYWVKDTSFKRELLFDRADFIYSRQAKRDKEKSWKEMKTYTQCDNQA